MPFIDLLLGSAIDRWQVLRERGLQPGGPLLQVEQALLADDSALMSGDPYAVAEPSLAGSVEPMVGSGGLMWSSTRSLSLAVPAYNASSRARSRSSSEPRSPRARRKDSRPRSTPRSRAMRRCAAARPGSSCDARV